MKINKKSVIIAISTIGVGCVALSTSFNIQQKKHVKTNTNHSNKIWVENFNHGYMSPNPASGPIVKLTVLPKIGFKGWNGQNIPFIENEKSINPLERKQYVIMFGGTKKNGAPINDNFLTLANLENGDHLIILIIMKNTVKGVFASTGGRKIRIKQEIKGLDDDITSKLPKAIATGFNGHGKITPPSNTTEFTVTADKTSNLSNGDIITYTYTAKPGFTFKGQKTKTSTQTVKGLDDDITSKLPKAIVTGFNGHGKITPPSNTTEFTVTADKTSNLSNGDIITYTYTAKPGFTFKGQKTKTSTQIVGGLITKITPSKITLKLTGFNGHGKITPPSNTTEFTVTADKTSNLSNGDIITYTYTAKKLHVFNLSNGTTSKTWISTQTVKDLKRNIIVPSNLKPTITVMNGKATITLPKLPKGVKGTVTIDGKPVTFKNGKATGIDIKKTNVILFKITPNNKGEFVNGKITLKKKQSLPKRKVMHKAPLIALLTLLLACVISTLTLLIIKIKRLIK